MKYKVLSMDLDGTLLTSSETVSEKNKQAVLEYKNNNYIILGITARNLPSAKSVCDINMFDYMILNNGSHIYDVKKNKETSINYFDRSVVEDLTNYYDKKAYEIDYCSLRKYYIYKNKKKFGKDFLISVNSLNEVKEKIVKINIFINDENKLNENKSFIEKNFDNINVYIMSDTDNVQNGKWLTLNPKGISKIETLKIFCRNINVSTSEIIFFGDGANDLSIINEVGLGVAMGNALDEVKKQAKAITLSNDEDGIAYYLKEMLQK